MRGYKKWETNFFKEGEENAKKYPINSYAQEVKLQRMKMKRIVEASNELKILK
jgi:hypothetical protein